MDLNEIGNTISDIILSEYNKKIKYDLGLEDYLKSYTKDELLKFYATYLVYNDKLDELLTFKAINGQKKAEIISKAAGVTLDEIIDINYSWVDVDYRSVQYDVCEERMKMNKYMNSNEEYEIDIEPEYIQKSDNVTLVYRIK